MRDCRYVADHLSEADRLEVSAARGGDMRAALHECFLKSQNAWAVFPRGGDAAVFVFGVARGDWRWMNMWALSTPAVNEYPLAFAKGSRGVADMLFAMYPHVRGYVDARHVKSIRWLEFLGFKLGAPVEYGLRGEVFYLFYHSGR